MKKIFFTCYFLLISIVVVAGTEQWINSTGSGLNYEEAKNNSLRNALQMAFGAFVSSETVINKDLLEKDEIVSITSGKILKFTEVSTVVIDGNYSVTLRVLVSPEKFVEFIKSKGMSIEYAGMTYGSNIRIQKVNEQNEINCIKSLATYAKKVIPLCFDFEISATKPYGEEKSGWSIGIMVPVKANINFTNLLAHIIKTLNNLSLADADIATRREMGSYVYGIVFNIDGKEGLFKLRTNDSRLELVKIFDSFIKEFLKGKKVLMDAGIYSQEIKYETSDGYGNSGLKLSYYGFKINNHPLERSGAGDITRLSIFQKSKNEVASLYYDLFISGKGFGRTNALEIIESIKGFRVF